MADASPLTIDISDQSETIWREATSPRCKLQCASSPKCKCVMPSIQLLIENNKVWKDRKMMDNPEYFSDMAKSQKPRYLWIGCSDSRVPAEEITGLSPGEMFVHRNVSNLVISNDISSLAVLQFAIEKLRVKDIIICGHYGCGGVQAAMDNKQLGLLDNWLRNIRDVCRTYHSELSQIRDEQARFDRLVELNIIEQCLNVFKINMVQRCQIKYGYPRIHGLAYDIKTGSLKALDVDFQGYLRSFSGIYRLHSFPTDTIPNKRWQLQANLLADLVKGHEETENTISIRYLQRAMNSEPELFDDDEISACIEHAKCQSQSTQECESAFVDISAVLSFFGPASSGRFSL
uniref:Carbonic anhydrase n=1 Tax=Albugo laibachii Nc14 TaxID=890382 RepID=F0WR54_9STRA|nr:carbonic anhydrase putative [Albugo laibachii Nc14]|eukprot:CCA23814.1 carbonic anhydrase putative [Albugo laibachii Nc14]